MSYHSYTEVLRNYMPAEAAELASKWLIDYNFDLKITRERRSKLGDYMAPIKNNRHKITINHNLNEFSFLITFVHEVAHLTTYEKYGNSVKAHGAEWKAEFRGLMHPFFEMAVFPEDIGKALIRYLGNPAATSCGDINLQKVLRKYDKNLELNSNSIHLEELAPNAIFKYNKRYFVRGLKLKKRIKCRELKSNSEYLFNPITLVEIVQNTLL